jgi:hypothetical protein
MINALRGISRFLQSDTRPLKTVSGAGAISDGCIQPRTTLSSELMRRCDGQRIGWISASGSSGNRIEFADRSRVEL